MDLLNFKFINFLNRHRSRTDVLRLSLAIFPHFSVSFGISTRVDGLAMADSIQEYINRAEKAVGTSCFLILYLSDISKHGRVVYAVSCRESLAATREPTLVNRDPDSRDCHPRSSSLKTISAELMTSVQSCPLAS